MSISSTKTPVMVIKYIHPDEGNTELTGFFLETEEGKIPTLISCEPPQNSNRGTL